jgi:outer membrane biosynthesis protein TonB
MFGRTLAGMVTGLVRIGLALAVLASCASSSGTGPVARSGTEAPTTSRAAPLEVAASDVKLAVDVSKGPHQPRLPPALDVRGNVVWGVFHVCADAAGEVSDVVVVTSAAPEVDADWIETIRTWRYQPHQQGGQPVPFCYKLRLSVASSR